MVATLHQTGAPGGGIDQLAEFEKMARSMFDEANAQAGLDDEVGEVGSSVPTSSTALHFSYLMKFSKLFYVVNLLRFCSYLYTANGE
jgi:hypothetical protein